MRKILSCIKKTDGFTLAETLVSIAIVLIISSCIILAFSSGSKTLVKAIGAVTTSSKLLQIDRHIRESADDLHIPYWLNPDISARAFVDELRRSKIGKYIQEVVLINNSSGFVRGVTVEYVVNNKRLKTSALFPTAPVLEKVR
jgi:prepilin-type N-terminal cleavage/methylation domain-containing protein